jgi:hypothetical protein
MHIMNLAKKYFSERKVSGNSLSNAGISQALSTQFHNTFQERFFFHVICTFSPRPVMPRPVLLRDIGTGASL